MIGPNRQKWHRAPRTAGVLNSRAAAVLVTLAVAALAGCTDDDGNRPASPSPSVAVSPSSTVDRADAAAADASLTAYNRLREAYIKAAAKADTNNAELAKYAAHPLLGQLQATLMTYRNQGLIVTGRPTWHASVTTVNISAQPYTVDLQDCLDTTNWHTVHKDTGTSAAVPGQATRYVVTARATLYDDGRWLIRESTAHREQPC